MVSCSLSIPFSMAYDFLGRKEPIIINIDNIINLVLQQYN